MAQNDAQSSRWHLDLLLVVMKWKCLEVDWSTLPAMYMVIHSRSMDL